ncbi:snake venom 5'-nucleotidase isoform X1 [Dermacentor silvarum]|uniref:snake venom 5'-nucleotidase isoform X1 n=1 Tax=Dermacentor silvarum TaxID=543639 RepID=UPI002100C023|nr:snake venom 5'-nucleotidase isoform X1 [Dermacentor silvarum]
MRLLGVLVCFFLVFSPAIHRVCADFTLTVLHTNDVHSHIEESTKYGGLCTGHRADCVGGIARIATKVNELKKTYPNTIFVNAGDFFQGTAWYTVLKSALVSEVMVAMGYDYACLGNHEFDNGPSELAPFLQKVSRSPLKFVSCNTDFSRSSNLRHIDVPKSVITTMQDTKVGIIGAVIEDTKFLSNPGPVKFFDAAKSIQKEARVLKNMGAKIIIAITHIGYLKDIELIRNVTDVDLVIGGHTNTFLYNGNDHPPENVPAGPYPTTVKRSDGTTGLVVQAFWFGKFLGFLRVTFDDDGRVKSWSGNPILINSSIPEDPHILRVIEPHRERVYHAMRIRVGSSRVSLEHAEDVCRLRECNLGNLVADSYFNYYANKKPRSSNVWSNVNGAIVNGGSLRAPILRTASVTMGDILSALPFGQTIVVATMNGKSLKKMMEYSMSNYNVSSPAGSFLHVSGMKVEFDVTRPPMQRLVLLEILCTRCYVPVYEKVRDDAVYNVATTDFLAKGGDGFDVCTNVSEGGPIEYELLVDYFKQMSPIKAGIERRVILHGVKTKASVEAEMTDENRQ